MREGEKERKEMMKRLEISVQDTQLLKLVRLAKSKNVTVRQLLELVVDDLLKKWITEQ